MAARGGSLISVVFVASLTATVGDCPRAQIAGTTPPVLLTKSIDGFGGLPLVQASVNGGPLRWFILDSASTFCILDRKEAHAAGLKSTGGRAITGGGDTIARIEFVDNVRMEMYGLRFGPMRLGVMATSFDFDRPIVGLIGAPFFREYVVGLDLQRQVLTAWNAEWFRYSGPGVIVPFVLNDDIPKINIGIRMPDRPQVMADLLVDTAASQSIILNRPFVQANGLDRSPGARASRKAGSLTGGTRYELARAVAVTVGTREFKDVLVGFSQDRVGSGSRTDRAGTIGNSLLRNFHVIFDYRRGRLILEPTRRTIVPFDYEVTGMVLVSASCGAVVKDIADGSVAAAAGVRPGDCLERIDNLALAGMALDEIKALFRHDGRLLTIGLRRGCDALSLQLQMLKVGI